MPLCSHRTALTPMWPGSDMLNKAGPLTPIVASSVRVPGFGLALGRDGGGSASAAGSSSSGAGHASPRVGSGLGRRTIGYDIRRLKVRVCVLQGGVTGVSLTHRCAPQAAAGLSPMETLADPFRRSKVLLVKDWRLWDWEVISDLLDGPLALGPSLTDTLARTKFMRRLGGFLRAETGEKRCVLEGCIWRGGVSDTAH